MLESSISTLKSHSMVKTHLGGIKIWGANGLTFGGPMVLHLGGQWSGANGLGGQSSIYPLDALDLNGHITILSSIHNVH